MGNSKYGKNSFFSRPSDDSDRSLIDSHNLSRINFITSAQDSLYKKGSDIDKFRAAKASDNIQILVDLIDSDDPINSISSDTKLKNTKRLEN